MGVSISVRSLPFSSSLHSIDPVSQLDPENGRLQFIQTRVQSRDLADITLAPAILAQQPGLLPELWVVGHNHAGVAQGAKILCRIETEGRHVSPGAALSPSGGGPMRLRTILDHPHPMTIRDGSNELHIGHVSIKVHRDDRLGPCRDGPLNPIRIDHEVCGSMSTQTGFAPQSWMAATVATAVWIQ